MRITSGIELERKVVSLQNAARDLLAQLAEDHGMSSHSVLEASEIYKKATGLREHVMIDLRNRDE